MTEEPSRGQSLDQILASIRNSLTGVRAPSAAEPEAAPPAAAEPDATPSPPTAEEADPTAFLSGKLASALNGHVNGAYGGDDDFADLLAHVPKRDVDAVGPTSPAVGTTVPSASGQDLKDPPWFLSATPVSEPADGAPDAASRLAGIDPVPKEEPELSRPETLRASLPPLFDGEKAPAPVASFFGSLSGSAPLAPLFSGDGSPAAAPSPPKDAVAGIKMMADAKIAKAAEPAKAPTVVPTPAADKIEPPAAVSAPAKPATVAVEDVRADTDRKPEKGPVPVVDAASPANGKPAEAPQEAPAAPVTEQARALEEMVAQLLEPVMRRWIDNNLPRMVEKVVREQVARSIETERDRPKV